MAYRFPNRFDHTHIFAQSNGMNKITKTDQPLFSFSSVTKRFGEQISINNISFSVMPGDFCTILGSNGSGKSTLFRLITGELLPDTGEITSRFILSQESAIVSQNPAVGTIGELTLAENITLGLLRNKSASLQSYAEKEAEIGNIIASLEMGLEDKLSQKLASFSGGQRQSIATLMAFISCPQLLLLDEHTSALDPRRHRELMTYTAKEIEARALTTLMITHDMRDALTYGNRLIMLSAGRIVLDLSGEEKRRLTERDLHDFFYRAHMYAPYSEDTLL